MSVQRVTYSRHELLSLKPLCTEPPVIPEHVITLLRKNSIWAVPCPLPRLMVMPRTLRKKTVTSSITFHHLNVRSIRSRDKFEAFKSVLKTPDSTNFSGLMETFLDDGIPSHLFTIDSYTTHRKDCLSTVKQGGGGILLYTPNGRGLQPSRRSRSFPTGPRSNEKVAHDIRVVSYGPFPVECICAFIPRCALAVTHKAKRRTLLPEDVVEALDANGFSAYRSKVIPIVEKRRSNFHKRGPKVKPAESSKPADEQAAGEPPSKANGDPAKELSHVQKAEFDEDDRKEDQNDATMEEESSEDEVEGTEPVDQESASGEDEDENEEENEEDEEDSHHASIASRPTDPPPSDAVAGRSKEEDEASSDSTED